MGVSLAVAGIRTAVSATRQSQINAGEKRWGERNRQSVENIRETRRKKGFGKEKEEKEMVLKEEKRNASKYVLIWFLTPLKFHIFFNDEHMSWC